MRTGLIQKCPNCEERDKNIPPMEDGSCGVCGGTGKIEWKEVQETKDTWDEEHDWRKLVVILKELISNK